LKNITTISLFVFLCFAARAQQSPSKLPDLVQPGSLGYLKGKLIYSLENRPTPECHASTLVESSSGIMAAWLGGSHEKNRDVGIWISHLQEDGWSSPVEVANGIQDEKLRYPCWNPVLFQPADGPLMLFYKVGSNLMPSSPVYSLMGTEACRFCAVPCRMWPSPMTVNHGRL
jgi:hypothetical protein